MINTKDINQEEEKRLEKILANPSNNRGALKKICRVFKLNHYR